MAEKTNFYQRNSQQKQEAIWIGRDTTTGQHTTVSPKLGKIHTRTVQNQQIDRDSMFRTMELQPSERTNKRTDKEMKQRPPQMYKLRSLTQPALRQQPGTKEQRTNNHQTNQQTSNS
eukprot:5030231-Amphidinium_carterae.1